MEAWRHQTPEAFEVLLIVYLLFGLRPYSPAILDLWVLFWR